MDGLSRTEEQACHHFLDLLAKERSEWFATKAQESELELSLGPPGGATEWTVKATNTPPNTSRNYFPNSPCVQNQNPVLKPPHFLHHLQSGQPVMEESSQPCSNREEEGLQISEKEAFSAGPAKTAVPSSAQKRTASTQVVGWPPIRSFRKNFASGGSTKLASESINVAPDKVSSDKGMQECPKSMFVKINMDGIPIGRKVDLKAFDSYEKLSHAVDELFRGLLAAQSDCSAEGGGENEGSKASGGGLLNGEYTLVYEDNEGDQMLVGDVPWHMFASTVKRLRVLRSAKLPALSRGSKRGAVHSQCLA